MTKKNKKQIKPRIIFMGTSDFAGIILQALTDAHHQISAVVTQPDYSGKRRKITISPVKQIARENKIKEIWQPQKLDDAFIKQVADKKPDLIIVAAYGKILPEKLLKVPKFKSINVHASLLPKLRGPSPIQNALFQGFTKTGTTIMLMDKGIDTGDILTQEKIKIEPTDDYLTLTSKLGILSANLLLKTIPDWIAGKIEPQKQNSDQATMCQLIERQDGKIRWNKSAQDIFNMFRAFRVWPGIFTFWEHKDEMQKISLTDISFSDKNHPDKKIGEVFRLTDNQVGIQAGQGTVLVKKLQLAGKKEVPVEDFLNGYPKFIGSVLK